MSESESRFSYRPMEVPRRTDIKFGVRNSNFESGEELTASPSASTRQVDELSQHSRTPGIQKSPVTPTQNTTRLSSSGSTAAVTAPAQNRAIDTRSLKV